ncbi:MAG: pyruvate formate lyase activating enzyme [Campylobacterota bacterium]|nr:pyruvate formate lyase activating enzyme [Campylobacterota bacterium]
MHNPIYDITPFTALDFPDHLTTIFWFAGCNMRCSYCYNKNIVFGKGKIAEAKALEFLKTRVGLLEGVVLSGGECTLYPEILVFCQKIKELGFKIKIDTNGLEFTKIKHLIDNHLVDYIALDYKAPKYKFLDIAKSDRFEDFSKTLDYIILSNINYEVRTTVHIDILDENDINAIIKDLAQRGYNQKYYLQEFVYSDDTIGRLQMASRKLNKELLNSDIEIVVRK